MRLRSRRVLAAAVIAALCVVAGPLNANFVGGENKIERRLERLCALDDARFMHELGVPLGPPFLPGTQARAPLVGDEIFPPMLAAIRGAQVSIIFETCIDGSGDIDRAFADARAERARQGAKVHVLLDRVGCAKLDHSLMAVMAQAGVQVRRLNSRTHRKLLVVDAATASMQAADLETDLALAHRVSHAQWPDRRGWLRGSIRNSGRSSR
jgi:cardiolipin synthase